MNEVWEKPQSVAMFPLTLTHKGGAPVEVMLRVVGTTGDLQAPMPRPVVLKDTAQVPLTVQTPYRNGYLDDTGTVTYEVSARDPSSKAPVGEAQVFTVTVHTKGMYVPGPQLFAAMFAVAIAALLLRRR